MRIIFTPAIAETIHVSPVVLATQTSSSVSLRFTASIRNSDYDLFCRQGAKLQLWSNCPCQVGSGWGEHDFTEHPGCNVSKDDNALLVLLHPVLLPPGIDELTFLYTYRICHPSGNIEWLGNYGRNGSFIIHRQQPFLSLGDNWYTDDGITYRLKLQGRNEGRVEILSVNKVEDCKISFVGLHGKPGCPSQFSIVSIVPTSCPFSHILSNAFLLSSSNIPMTCSLAGTINILDMGDWETSLLLQMYDCETDMIPIIQKCSAHGQKQEFRVVAVDKESGSAIFATPLHHYPIHLTAIRLMLVPLGPSSRVWFHHADMRDLFLEDTDAICVYSPFNSRIRTFMKSEVVAPGRTKISCDVGVQYTISPAYCLLSQGEAWRISILSNYTTIRMFSIQTVTSMLPTPPPSPHVTQQQQPGFDGDQQGQANSVSPLTSSSGPKCHDVSMDNGHHMNRTSLTSAGQGRGIMAYVQHIVAMASGMTYKFLYRSSIVFGGAIRTLQQFYKGVRSWNHDCGDKLMATAEKHHDYESRTSIESKFPGGLCAQVSGGMLIVFIHPDCSKGDQDAIKRLTIKKDNQPLEVALEHTDEGSFLLRTFIDKDSEIEIAFV
ncbi:hypothetical protein AMATHDRAFT_41709 [Amanita thiersii Skay4041]|uniref:Uncharacterized protein n=1 Tax=Amanita thiersii Skay4041 TaxID=703135 RepID=A0A2A9NF15_9AGAR|nr:hypothetical protein AMATHDRAFT_41709 [Amanita thiersii Skay4041]